jgi:archaellum component FlaC
MIVAPAVTDPCFSAEKSETTLSDVAEKTEQAVETAKKFTAYKREAYQKSMQAKLDDLSKRIAELEKQAGTATKDVRAALEKRIEQLKVKRGDAEKRLRELRASAASAWKGLKAKADEALQDLRKAYEAARSLTQ